MLVRRTQIVRVDHELHAAGDEFRLAPSDHVGEGGVDLHDIELRRHQRHARRRYGEQILQLVARRLELAQQVVPFRHVDERRHRTPRYLGRIVER